MPLEYPASKRRWFLFVAITPEAGGPYTIPKLPSRGIFSNAQARNQKAIPHGKKKSGQSLWDVPRLGEPGLFQGEKDPRGNITSWKPKHPLENWLFQFDDSQSLPWKNECFTKHPFNDDCLGLHDLIKPKECTIQE